MSDSLFDGAPPQVRQLHQAARKMKRQERRQEWKEAALRAHRQTKPAVDLSSTGQRPER